MAAPAPTNIKQIEQATQSLPVIGHILWWNMAGVVTPFLPFQAAWVGAGLPTVQMHPTTPRLALRRAIEGWLDARAAAYGLAPLTGGDHDESVNTGTGNPDRSLVRCLNPRKGTYIVYTLVTEKANFAKLGLKHATSLRVFLNKSDDTMFVTTEDEGLPDAVNEAVQIARELVPYWAKYTGSMLGNDISRLVRQVVLRMGGILLRREGGMYFLPDAQTAQARALQSVVENLSPQSFFTLLGVPDTVEAKASMVKSIHMGLVSEMEKAQADLDELSGNKGSIRPATMADRMENLKLLRSKVLAMSDLLEFQRDDLLKGLTKLRASVRKLADVD